MSEDQCFEFLALCNLHKIPEVEIILLLSPKSQMRKKIGRDKPAQSHSMASGEGVPQSSHVA